MLYAVLEYDSTTLRCIRETALMAKRKQSGSKVGDADDDSDNSSSDVVRRFHHYFPVHSSNLSPNYFFFLYPIYDSCIEYLTRALAIMNMNPLVESNRRLL